METLPLQSVYQDFDRFLSAHRTVTLATLNAQGQADASYAPYIRQGEHLYIYLSELAKHTANLLNHPTLSLLFIEDESKAQNIFARKRVTLRGHASEIARETEKWHQIMDLYGETLGETAQNLRHLADFHLFEITIEQANFVRGFAQAYELSGEDLRQVRHINDRGHGQSKLKTQPA